ncbi:AraC family transcriptional regulator [Bacillus infantis]|uniref:AraC family transcriptional regulator n=1 Tax=Bacillus infantis TaxID=324767 RepID=UPI003CEEB975
MDFKTEMVPEYRIAYVRQTGPYGPANQHVMEELKRWAKERSLLDEAAIILGISHDHPQTTPSESCRYDACIVIPEEFEMDASMEEGEFPGGEYAVFQVQHTEEEIQKLWAEILPSLHNLGFQLDNRPAFERYTGAMLLNHQCEVCLPVKEL